MRCLIFYLPLLLLLCASNTRSKCVCTPDTCTCSGADVLDLSGLLLQGICPEGGNPTRLVFEDVPNLTDLPNGFSPLQSARCQGLKNPEILKLHRTGIHNLSSTLFQGLHNLHTLDLSENPQFKSYRDEAFRALGGTLIELIATNNRVHSLTKTVFSGLRKLRRLVLSNNKIGYIENDAFATDCCGQLTDLSLDGNILTDLEDETFAGLNSLQRLDLRGNPLQRLSSRLFSPFAATLTQLWMKHDDTASFGGFESIPDGLFSGMSNLEELSIVEMKLRNLSASTFVGLENLQTLSLHGNRLNILSRGCFTPLTGLVELDLSANGLVCLPDNSDEYHPRLRSLDLSKNGLTHLTRRSFSSLASSPPTSTYPRFMVNISANPIQRIEPDAFCGFNGPVELILSPPASQVPSWANMDGWPNNPFALVGNGSLIHGLSDTEGPVRGRDDSSTLCGPEGQLFHPKILSSTLYTNSNFKEKDIVDSLKSECPWLTPQKLSQWQLSKMGVRGLAQKGSDSGYTLEEGSRIYLLIIVAVCITFLLAALTIIMCYRAWSRRSTQKMVGDAEMNLATRGCEPSSVELGGNDPASEKNELLEGNRNGRPTTVVLPGAVSEESAALKTKDAAEKQTTQAAAAAAGRRNSEPRGEELETMTAFGVL